MQLAPTPKDTVLRDGSARLYRFRPSARAPVSARRLPVVLVPSLINRWYILDLRSGSSVVEALVDAGLETYCLDWGAAEDEDRYLTWDDLLARLARAVRFVQRSTGAGGVTLLGYCMGGTLAGIFTALEPDRVAALVNLAGPFDFAHAGPLGVMTDARWFDPAAVAAAGNVHPFQMQSGFVMLRPTLSIAKWVGLVERWDDANARDAFIALETWASDNIAFPAAAYATYVKELYQENRLVRGGHYVGGRRVDLSAIGCPVLSVVAERDTICPPPAAAALCARVSASETRVLTIPGGHVGAVVGAKAKAMLYPAVTEWLAVSRHTAPSISRPTGLDALQGDP